MTNLDGDKTVHVLYGCSDIKGGTQIERAWEQGAEENIWTEDGRSGRRLGENYIGRSFIIVLLAKYN
jgi:hypothetical protein